MGCDIHLIVQARRDGVWEDVVLNLDEEVEYDEFNDSFWESQSYATFALLADVRNDPADGITPISTPRGLPDDFECQDDRRPSTRPIEAGRLIGDVERNGKDLGEHSHSWVTLAELKAVPADQRWALPEAWIPELEKFGAPDDVRLVFGFDS
jgi:hypothetical protein